MKPVSISDLRELLAPSLPPCVSIYQPTHRRHPENHQDPIRFRNLVTEAEASLRKEFPNREIRPLLEPFHALGQDRDFWNHTLDGLAVFGTPDSFRVFHLQRPVPQRVVVAESLHIKPLIRIVQSAERYQVLCLSRDSVKLFEGNRDALDPIDLAREVPRTNAEAQSVGVEGRPEWPQTGPGGSEPGAVDVWIGHGSQRDIVKTDAERFFRAVDRAVLEHHSKPSGLPLILAALPDNEDVFRRVSHNSALLPQTIRHDPQALSDERLRAEAWQVVQPYFLERLAKLVDAFGEARSKRQGSGDLSDIAPAAMAGRVATLLVEAERVVPGSIDPTTGRISLGELASPDVDDLLDDLAELVLRNGGETIVVPAEKMPTNSGAAAIYRF